MKSPGSPSGGQSPKIAHGTPRSHIDNHPLPTDSMVTVSLSEDGGVSDFNNITEEIFESDTSLNTRKRSSSLSSDGAIDSTSESSNRTSSLTSREQHVRSPCGRSRTNSMASIMSEQVDWAELERTEEREGKENVSDNSIALLLARLEQENNNIAQDPKSGLRSRSRAQSRPPSISHLRKLVSDPSSGPVRVSLLPSPPPMTELDFWAALVRDYSQTAQRLPTLTSNKVRSGVPAPLRGVVWVSMAGARDRTLEEQFDKLCGESSPYENIIGKDIGRSFPGVEMFRDPEGEGQKMLGRVLKSYSLYDDKIGYCQGLGFLVGPLLMQMGDKEAFCVLVRLMEDYDLRSCFLPDLSGLHLRIFQFQRLLHIHLPQVATHLDSLQVEGAYLSQWFLSFFAVTCPLPMLFRIYDVIFAEGASETIMRVALSIMKRNEKKILAFTEFEDVMQLLLSRALWDPYGLNTKSADEFVDDFVTYTEVVTRESLQSLETSFKQSQNDSNASKSTLIPGVQSAASRFLGRLWTSSNSSSKPASLSPGLAGPTRPGSFLRRTTSKQSLASTLNSIEGASDGSSSHASTTPTELTTSTRVSAGEEGSAKFQPDSAPTASRMNTLSKDKDLHSQIEDLLVALSEMQKQQSLLTAHLERAKEERKEDHRIAKRLIDKLKSANVHLHAEKTLPRQDSKAEMSSPEPCQRAKDADSNGELKKTIELLDARLNKTQQHQRMSSAFETKEMLRKSLARSKDQLAEENVRAQLLSSKLAEVESETHSVREELKEARRRLQESHSDRQRLERTIRELKNDFAKSTIPRIDTSGSVETPSLTRSNATETQAPPSTVSSGLRELKLGRTSSNQTPTFSKRSSSLATQAILATENHAPAAEDALLLELVNAKTAEAVAKQELEELRSKFEAMRRMLGLQTPASTGFSPEHTAVPSESGSSFFGLSISKKEIPTPHTAPASGGFWGWGKRSASTNAVTGPTASEGA